MKKRMALWMALLTFLMIFSGTAGAFNGNTSFEFRYPEAFTGAVRRYPAFSEALDEKRSVVPVPGNKVSDAYSREGGAAKTENMVAQGLCVTDDHIFVTAYDSEKEYDSLLYVLSNEENSKILAVIVLPDKNHCGGVAVDGRNVYIAGSDSGIFYFSFGLVEKAIASGEVFILDRYDGTVKTEKTASFVTVYGSTLWLGEFNEKSDSFLCDYKISDNGSLQRGDTTLVMPKKLQGAAFFEKNGSTYLFASCSYGRTNTSNIYLYEIRDGKNEMLYRYAFPPMAEEAAFHDGTVYLIFESSATHYSTKESRCPTPVDRIAALNADVLTDENTENKALDFFVRVRDVVLKIIDRIASVFR